MNKIISLIITVLLFTSYLPLDNSWAKKDETQTPITPEISYIDSGSEKSLDGVFLGEYTKGNIYKYAFAIKLPKGAEIQKIKSLKSTDPNYEYRHYNPQKIVPHVFGVDEYYDNISDSNSEDKWIEVNNKSNYVDVKNIEDKTTAFGKKIEKEYTEEIKEKLKHIKGKSFIMFRLPLRRFSKDSNTNSKLVDISIIVSREEALAPPVDKSALTKDIDEWVFCRYGNSSFTYGNTSNFTFVYSSNRRLIRRPYDISVSRIDRLYCCSKSKLSTYHNNLSSFTKLNTCYLLLLFARRRDNQYYRCCKQSKTKCFFHKKILLEL